MISLTELLAKVEAASGPDRELDRALAKLAGWHRVEPRFTSLRRGGWIAPEDFMGLNSDGSPRLDSLHGTEIHRDVPAYTASLDAALSLVERCLPGWTCEVSGGDPSRGNNGLPAANLTPHLNNDAGWASGAEARGVHRGATPALAILAALLKALIAKDAAQ